MRHVRLKSERLGPVHQFEQLDVMPPAMHATPADLAFRRQALAEVFRDGTGFAEGPYDPLRVCVRILRPLGRTGRGVDADHAVLADLQTAKPTSDPAGFLYLLEKTAPLRIISHRRSAARGRPHRSHQRADAQSSSPDSIRQKLQVVIGRVDIRMRRRQEQIHSVESHPVHCSGAREIKHRVQVEGWLGVGSFAN